MKLREAGVFEIIFIVLMVLKLTGLFTGSWWVVFSPLIIELVLIAIVWLYAAIL